MGIELFIAAAALGSNYMNTKNARKEARAVTQQAGIQAENKATETMAKAAYQKNSFLASGFTLEGTPMAVLESTYTTGQKDINQIIANANMQSKNIMGAARSKALSNLGSMGMTMYTGGMFDSAINSTAAGMTNTMSTSMASYMPDSFLYSANMGGAGNNAYSAFDLKDMRF